MFVAVKLYGTLRDLLPPETKGKSDIDIAEGATIEELLAMLGVEHEVSVAINGDYQTNESAVLKEGDVITVFEMTAGG